MQPGFAAKYLGIIKPMSIDDPIIQRFLPEVNETNWRLDNPTEVTIPKLTRTIPPRTGSGIRVKRAPNLPHTPAIINIIPAAWNARRLATWK